MTNLDAIRSAIYPYDVDEMLLLKVCIDEGIGDTIDYDLSFKANIARASINVLSHLLALSSENNGGYSLTYDTDMLKKRICSIAKENGFTDIAKDYEEKPIVYIGID